MSRRWEIVLHDDVDHAWLWRCLAPDGTIEESSSPLPDFGKAIADAIQHGFQPQDHDWTVRTAVATTHFPAHKPPTLIGRNSEVVQRPEDVPPKVANPDSTDSPPDKSRRA